MKLQFHGFINPTSVSKYLVNYFPHVVQDASCRSCLDESILCGKQEVVKLINSVSSSISASHDLHRQQAFDGNRQIYQQPDACVDYFKIIFFMDQQWHKVLLNYLRKAKCPTESTQRSVL